MKRTSLRDYAARRIALVKPSALGDVVHALPVLSALRRRFPRAHITWVINRSYEPLIQGHPHLDATLAFDRGVLRRGWLGSAALFAAFLRRLRQERFDLIIDLQGLFRTGLMCLASGAARRVGLASAREGARWFYTDVVDDGPRHGDELHAVDRYWTAAEALGVGDMPKTFFVPIRPEDQAWSSAALAGLPRPWIMMNAGTRWETKRWPARHFADLGRRALARFGGGIVLVGGVEETPLARQLRADLGQPVLDFTGRTDVRQLAALLARADLVVSNDSGPLHLAVALGRPVLAPYTCTSPKRTGPYGRPAGAVCTTVWCAASYLKRCPRLECMHELTPDRLYPVLERTLLRGVTHQELQCDNLSA